ncbi:MAG: CofH family radical SAM protein [Chlamydiales bacterium]
MYVKKTNNQTLHRILDKVCHQERLTPEEALSLLKTTHPDELECIRSMADKVREEKVGHVVTFASTLYIHPTNLCELNCPLCSFYAKPGWKKAWFLTPADIQKKIQMNLNQGLTEIHIVGGLWRECNLDYYEEVFKQIKTLDPNLHIKALTPVEYDFLSKLHHISIQEVFKKMMSWGLGSLPGGGAEILVEEIRKKIAPGKITSDEYLAIHKQAHLLGLHSNITMLFGHLETYEHIVTHLTKVRDLQDDTNGFRAFIPLKFGEENNALGKRKNALKNKNTPLIYAVSRLFLDNIPHLKILWNYIGIKDALEILRWGGNDLSSTNTEEKIIAMAGGSNLIMNKETMASLILKAGRTPLLTHSGSM